MTSTLSTGAARPCPRRVRRNGYSDQRKTAADLRDYLAEERTFRAWIRTGIALMGFGFVVARFGIFGDEPPNVAACPSRSSARVLTLGWSRAYRDRRICEPLFRAALWAPGGQVEPRS